MTTERLVIKTNGKPHPSGWEVFLGDKNISALVSGIEVSAHSNRDNIARVTLYCAANLEFPDELLARVEVRELRVYYPNPAAHIRRIWRSVWQSLNRIWFLVVKTLRR